MDPLSISASAAGLLTICVQTVQLLKRTIETLRNAKGFLLKLLTQTERVRLFLEQLRSITKQLGYRSEVLLSYNDSGPRETINELNTFVRDMAQSRTWVRLKVLLNQNAADKLVERLHRHEEEVMQVLMSIATASSIRTEGDIQKIYETIILHSRVTSPFGSDATTPIDTPGGLTDSPNLLAAYKEVVNDVSSPPSYSASPEIPYVGLVEQEDSSTENKKGCSAAREEPPQTAKKFQIWFGDLSRSSLDTRVLSFRDQLADFAFRGDFNKVLQVLADVEGAYGQSWVNAPRLNSASGASSGWTPLHHAVFTGASKKKIARLIQDFGAQRLLRTAWTSPAELPYRNMTAAEIAYELGYTDLCEVLAPFIYHCVPHGVLATLQVNFHRLIRKDLSMKKPEPDDLRLPDLVVLTELKDPLMWFPLKPSSLSKVRGYMYRLDGRDLLVKSFGISDDGSAKLYRISSTGTEEIEEAITFSRT